MFEGFSYDLYENAASFIRSRLEMIPDTAVVLGTGCGPFAGRIRNAISIPYASVPGFPVTTNTGHAGCLVAGYIGRKYIICMNGRFHFYEGYSMEELNIPVHVLHVLGVRTLVLTNAAGSCNPGFRPGDVMIIRDHIKLYGGSPMRGPNLDKLGPRFFGVYDMYTSRLTEALTAAHCGMDLLGLSLITNMATGMEDGNVDGSEVDAVALKASPAFSSYIGTIISSI